MKKQIAVSLAIILLFSVSIFAVDKDKAEYVGGTISTIKEGKDGKVSIKDENNFLFESKEGNLSIPFKKVTELEYGQKAGRRVAVAILISPLALFSKKRKHYLTINYTDTDNKPQAVVFELGKDIVRTTLAGLEARTGRQIQYQDDEARKSAKGN